MQDIQSSLINEYSLSRHLLPYSLLFQSEDGVKMRILQIVLAYLVLSVNTNVFGEITVEKFKKQNCRYGGPPIDGAVVEVKARSKLKCAAECSRQACKSYTYDKTTEACHLSSFLISDESGVWYCAPFSRKFHSCWDWYQCINIEMNLKCKYKKDTI